MEEVHEVEGTLALSCITFMVNSSPVIGRLMYQILWNLWKVIRDPCLRKIKDFLEEINYVLDITETQEEIPVGRNMLKHVGEKELEPACGIVKSTFWLAWGWLVRALG